MAFENSKLQNCNNDETQRNDLNWWQKDQKWGKENSPQTKIWINDKNTCPRKHPRAAREGWWGAGLYGRGGGVYSPPPAAHRVFRIPPQPAGRLWLLGQNRHTHTPSGFLAGFFWVTDSFLAPEPPPALEKEWGRPEMAKVVHPWWSHPCTQMISEEMKWGLDMDQWVNNVWNVLRLQNAKAQLLMTNNCALLFDDK